MRHLQCVLRGAVDRQARHPESGRRGLLQQFRRRLRHLRQPAGCLSGLLLRLAAAEYFSRRTGGPTNPACFAELDINNIAPHFSTNFGIILVLVGNPLRTIREPWFCDFVARNVRDKVPLTLGLPGPVGMQSGQLPLNTAAMIAAQRGAPAPRSRPCWRELSSASQAHDFHSLPNGKQRQRFQHIMKSPRLGRNAGFP